LASEAWRLVDEIAPYLRIAHQVGGRVRLNLTDDGGRATVLPQGGLARLRQMLGTVPGVQSIAINLLARSCVVQYDRAVIQLCIVLSVNSIFPVVCWAGSAGAQRRRSPPSRRRD
jgi:hypothetical protein